jgi:hypothetical protein
MISTGKAIAICVTPLAGGTMQSIDEAEAIAGHGIKGDRYCTDDGSYNKKRKGEGFRQVSLINARFFPGTLFEFVDSRRNIITQGVELLWLLDKKKEFQIGEAVFRAVKYLDPCARPGNLSGKPGFKEAFFDCGAIIAEVLKGGRFRVGDPVFHASKGY